MGYWEFLELGIAIYALLLICVGLLSPDFDYQVDFQYVGFVCSWLQTYNSQVPSRRLVSGLFMVSWNHFCVFNWDPF